MKNTAYERSIVVLRRCHSLSFQFHTDIECKLTIELTTHPHAVCCNHRKDLWKNIFNRLIFWLYWIACAQFLWIKNGLVLNSISFTHCNGYELRNRKVIVANTCRTWNDFAISREHWHRRSTWWRRALSASSNLVNVVTNILHIKKS